MYPFRVSVYRIWVALVFGLWAPAAALADDAQHRCMRGRRMLAVARQQVLGGRLDKALLMLDKAYTSNKANTHCQDLFVEICYQKADLLRLLHKLPEAQAVLKEALQTQPGPHWQARLLQRRGGIYLEMLQNDSARHFANLALQAAAPSDSVARFYASWIISKLALDEKRYDDALRYYGQTLQWAPASQQVNATLVLTQVAEVYWAQGKRTTGLQVLRQAYGISKQLHYPDLRASVAGALLTHTLKHRSQTELLAVFDDYQHLLDTTVAREVATLRSAAKTRQVVEEQKIKLHLLEHERKTRKYQQWLWIVASALLLAVVILLAKANRAYGRRQKRLAARQHLLTSRQALLEAEKNALLDRSASKNLALSVVSHDVRGPLGNLAQVLELMAQGDLSEEEEAELLASLAGQVRQAEMLLNDVLLWAKSHMDGTEVHLKPVALLALGTEVAHQVGHLLQERRVELDVLGAAPNVLADDGLLKVVMRNLLANAVRYGASPGRVVLQLGQQGGKGYFAVIDQGKGMPHALQERLLGRADGQTPARLSSQGLGLQLVHDFVAKIGGEVAVLSGPEGTTVRVSLPLAGVEATIC